MEDLAWKDFFRGGEVKFEQKQTLVCPSYNHQISSRLVRAGTLTLLIFWGLAVAA